MDKRHANFLTAAALIFLVNILLLRWFAPPAPAPQPPDQVAQHAEVPDDGAQPPDRERPEAGQLQPPDDAEAPPGDREAEQPEDVFPLAYATLGSIDASSPYRMLVMFTNQGAAVERIELNQPQFKDLDTLNDRGGYLGHLAPSTVERKPGGCLVRIVGPGTPAARAGLQAGDVIVGVDELSINSAAAFDVAMRATRPRQTIKLRIERDGQPQELLVRLTRYPLEVVKPEGIDQLSFLTTLAHVDAQHLEADAVELPGVDLRNGLWELLPADAQQPDTVAFRRRLTRVKLEIVKQFRLARLPDDKQEDPYFPAYHLEMRLEVRNLDSQQRELGWQIDGPTGLPTEGWWYSLHSKISQRFWSSAGLRDVVVGRYTGDSVKQELLTVENVVANKYHLSVPTPISYLGVDAQYFASVLIPLALPAAASPESVPLELPAAKPAEVAWTAIRVGPVPERATRKKLTNVTSRLVGQPVPVGAGDTWTADFMIFAGPKKPPLLSQYNRPWGLNQLVEYGWFGFVAKPMQWLLHGFAALTGNYGLAIVLLTVVVRSVMFPLSRNQALNAQKMQELQPEMKRLAEKYKDNMEARSKAQQELFKKHNYNPFSGCLPLFIQLPIFIGLYRALSVDVELRQAPLISTAVPWASNLAAPDMLFRWDSWMPEFLAGPDAWLGPYFNLLPCLTIALFLWQQKMFMPPPTDEQAAMQQKVMQYMMIFICVMFFKVPSGLCVYFIASSLWSVAERLLLPKAAKKADGPAPAATPARGGKADSPARARKQRERR